MKSVLILKVNPLFCLQNKRREKQYANDIAIKQEGNSRVLVHTSKTENTGIIRTNKYYITVDFHQYKTDGRLNTRFE